MALQIPKKPHTHLRQPIPAGILAASSKQTTLRHTQLSTYCCFRQDLTGFIALCCTGPISQRHLPAPYTEKGGLRREFSLARADCKYRAPLTPHLVRFFYYTLFCTRLQLLCKSPFSSSAHFSFHHSGAGRPLLLVLEGQRPNFLMRAKKIYCFAFYRFKIQSQVYHHG